MEFQIALMLVQDGITNGAIYALLALALVLVFAVTRVIFIPQGEFVAYGALTLAMLQAGVVPTTCGCWSAWVSRSPWSTACPPCAPGDPAAARRGGWNLAYPLAWPRCWRCCPAGLPQLARWLALAIVVPMGPQMYRLAYQPIASAPILILLIVSVAVHLAMVGLGLLFFGAEGQRTPPSRTLELGPLMVPGQTLVIVAVSLALIVALFQFFERTLYGKACGPPP
jgi:branched-chain amino acid transport system permease protein